MANQPISVSKANDMIQQYLTYMTGHGINMNNQTQTVIFTTPELLQWLNNTKGYTDEFRVCIGVYPNGDSRAGRMSAIIWPYKNGQPAVGPDTAGKGGTGGGTLLEPYNDGGLLP